jgi:hypothetical protein
MGYNPISTVLGAESAVQTFADLQGASNAALLDTYKGSLTLKDSVLTDVHKVSTTLQSATWSTKGALPTALTQALQTALTTTLTDTTKTGSGSVGLGFSLQNGLTDFLSAGETVTVVYNVSVSDGHGGTATQPVTFVITGTNAAPVVTSADVSGDNDDGSSYQYGSGWGWGSGSSAATVQGDVNFTDVNVDDTHTASATLVAAIPSSGAVSSALLSALGTSFKTSLNAGGNCGSGGSANDVTWSFTAPAALSSLAAGQAVLVEYLVQVADNHGGIATQPISLLLNSGSNQPVIVAGVTSAQIAEVTGAAAATAVDTASGAISLVGGDVTSDASVSSKLAFVNWSGGAAIPTASLAALNSALTLTLTNTGGGDCGSQNDFSSFGSQSGQCNQSGQCGQFGEGDDGASTVSWLFSAANKYFSFLTAGQTLTLAYEVTGKDSCGETVTRLITVTINGANSFVAPVAGPVSETVNENAVLTVQAAALLSHATDTNAGSTLSLTSVGNAQHGTVSLANGVVIFTPTAGYTGPASYQYTVTDNYGQTATGTATVTVNPIYVAPIAKNVSETVNENAVLTVQAATLLSNASDANAGSTLSLTSVGSGVNGTVSLSNGVVTFTPTAGYFGAASYQYTVTDNYGQSATATANVTVAPLPTTTTITETVNENAAITLTAQTAVANSGIVEPNTSGAPTVTSVGNAVNGTVSLVSGSVVFTPKAGYYGPASYQYTVTDTFGQSVTVTANVTVYAPLTANSVSEIVNENTTLTVTAASLLSTAAAADPNTGGVLTLASVQNATHGTVSLANGVVTFTPTTGYYGPASYQYTVTDNFGQSVTATANVTVYAPVTAKNVAETTNENTPLTVTAASLLSTAAAADPNTGGVLTLASVQNATHGTVSLANGVVTFTPTTGYYGPASYQYTVTDNFGQSVTATANVTVYAPVTAGNVAETTNENTALTVTAASLLSTAAAADPNAGGVLTLASVQNATHGTVSLANGVVTFTPTTGYYGPASYQYTVTDNFGQSVTATANVTVYAPVTAGNVTETTNENTALTVTAASLLSTAAAADPNTGGVLTLASVQNATHGTVSLANGVVTFTPTTGYYGPASYQYTVTDNFGQSVTATANVTVYAPPTAKTVSETVNENAVLTVQAATLLANATDPNAGAVLSLTSVGGAVNGTVALSNGVVTFTPAAGYYGPASYQYTVTDTYGQTATATANVTVYAPPTAGPVSESVNENAVLTVQASTLLANVTDLNLNSILSLTSVGNAVNGTVALSNGVVTFTPNPGYYGPASYQYTVVDIFGQSVTATANVTVYAPPVAAPVSETVNENAVLTVQASTLLANAVDLNAGAALSLTSVGHAVNGTVALSNGVVTFTPTTGYYGPASYQYTVTDNYGQTATATANVTVYAPPTAAPVFATVNENAVLWVSAATLLANATDPNAGAVLSLTISPGSAVHGTVSLNNGVVTFTPTTGYYGPASYQYTVTDNYGQTATSTVNVTVYAPPTAAPVSETVNENAVLTVQAATLLANAADANAGAVLSLTSVGHAVNGTVALSNGVVTFTPTTGYYGPASYQYTVTDNYGQMATATANVTVYAPPTAAPVSESVTENAVLTVQAADLLAIATDVNAGAVLSLTSVGSAVNGTVSLSNGVVTFTPTTGYTGSASYQYTVTDNYGQTATATANVTVNPMSVPPPLLTLVNVVGSENTAIPISISTSVTQQGELITGLVVSGLPVGSVLSDGAGHTFTAVAGTTQVDVSSWNLSTLTFSPVTYFSGLVPLTVTSTADIGADTPASTVGMFTVTVVAPPLAVNDTATVNEGTAKVLNVLFNDVDSSGFALSVVGVTNPAHGTVVLNANNTITYTPNAGYIGPDSFTYTNSDGYSGTSVATVNVNVVTPTPAVAPLLGVGLPGSPANSVGSIIPTDGSAINTVLTLHAGDVVSFNWNFAAGDRLPYNDFAFVAVNGMEFMLSDVQAVGTKGVSGAHTFTYTATTSGTYDFGIGVMNVQNNNNNSTLEVDNLAVNGATVLNFSNGLTGLNGVTATSMGTVVEVTHATAPNGTTLLPSNGTYEAFLTSSPVGENAIETYVGLPQNQLQYIVASVGAEFTPIALPVSVTSATNNPDQTYVTISGAPVGTVFNHGVYNSANNTWQIQASDLGGDLTLTTPASYSGSFNLSITATSVSIATGTTATTAAQTQFVTVNPAAVTIDGSAGNQVLVGGTTAGNTLIGGPGDTLTGGSTYDPTHNLYPSDTFVFNGTAFGQNTITDFETTSDVIQFSHTVFADANTALAHATQVGSDVVITYDAHDMVTLKNILLANLSASDFHII